MAKPKTTRSRPYHQASCTESRGGKKNKDGFSGGPNSLRTSNLEPNRRRTQHSHSTLLQHGDGLGFDMLRSDDGGRFPVYLENDPVLRARSLLRAKRSLSAEDLRLFMLERSVSPDTDLASVLPLERTQKLLLHHQHEGAESAMKPHTIKVSLLQSKTPPPGQKKPESSALLLETNTASQDPSDPRSLRASTPPRGGKCIACGTTDTPQWREVPMGLLCNFCGLMSEKRSRKRRRALSFV